MNRFRVLALAIGVMVPVASACSDDNSSPSSGATSFTATMMGSNEAPPVTTPATGTATLTVNGQQIEYTVNVTGITNAVVSHIHIAPAGENGPVRLNLCGTGAPLPACTSGTGVLAAGTNGTTVGTPAITFDSLVSAMRSGGAYVNVHTNSEGCTAGDPGCNPGGEIRGQVQVAN